jgi:disulfide bond formation protein DsbB
MPNTTSRTSYLLLAVVSLAMIACALYLQHVKDMMPCPLCVIQRYLFLGVALFALFAAAGRPPLRRAGTGLALLAALGGAGVAIYHTWIVLHPKVSCGIDPLETSLNKIFTATLLPSVFQADGICSTPYALLGLPVPAWSLAGFVLLIAGLVWLLVKRRA